MTPVARQGGGRPDFRSPPAQRPPRSTREMRDVSFCYRASEAQRLSGAGLLCRGWRTCRDSAVSARYRRRPKGCRAP